MPGISNEHAGGHEDQDARDSDPEGVPCAAGQSVPHVQRPYRLVADRLMA